uniref:Uncharacterized protein n=1 Tax=Chromera velia CCMP2878 TaxID=1169474 RepID=A0A0G4G5T8_9ALVE|eukprot:Cvel_20273.t1-p1 / transcript=Cvel_20273.t1 / gene=Cvel_20273 / organism=Chromera_velia_CCMP2878 / gene_product=hypothetical protein / transcript_product=hypothetical protein / location=Cvel_scaffold1809:1744-2304(-) / protein_length=187 / sequence_SO=supercontig / SO=protein_coding / is_pseudo=false
MGCFPKLKTVRLAFTPESQGSLCVDGQGARLLLSGALPPYVTISAFVGTPFSSTRSSAETFSGGFHFKIGESDREGSEGVLKEVRLAFPHVTPDVAAPLFRFLPPSVEVLDLGESENIGTDSDKAWRVLAERMNEGGFTNLRELKVDSFVQEGSCTFSSLTPPFLIASLPSSLETLDLFPHQRFSSA